MIRAVFAGVVLAAVAAAQPAYVDIYTAKVKPEKRTEYDALVKKMADANRKHKGDNWTASEVVYGEQNTLYFTSVRANLAAIDDGEKAFRGALKAALGAAVEKLMTDADKCIVSSRGELRRLRPDLTTNAPANEAELMKLVGKSRLVRTTMVRVRPGRTDDFEALLKMAKEAGERSGAGVTLVSQSSVGVNGTVFYVTRWGASMGDFDKIPSLQSLLGDRYSQFAKGTADITLGVETMILRYLPELSNPPEALVNTDPDFWKPKPAPAKPKATTSGT